MIKKNVQLICLKGFIKNILKLIFILNVVFSHLYWIISNFKAIKYKFYYYVMCPNKDFYSSFNKTYFGDR